MGRGGGGWQSSVRRRFGREETRRRKIESGMRRGRAKVIRFVVIRINYAKGQHAEVCENVWIGNSQSVKNDLLTRINLNTTLLHIRKSIHPPLNQLIPLDICPRCISTAHYHPLTLRTYLLPPFCADRSRRRWRRRGRRWRRHGSTGCRTTYECVEWDTFWAEGEVVYCPWEGRMRPCIIFKYE